MSDDEREVKPFKFVTGECKAAEVGELWKWTDFRNYADHWL